MALGLSYEYSSASELNRQIRITFYQFQTGREHNKARYVGISLSTYYIYVCVYTRVFFSNTVNKCKAPWSL